MAVERFTVDQVIESLRLTKGLMTLAAERLGCTYEALWHYSKRHPEIAEALKTEREKVTDVAELQLYNKITNGEEWAVKFYLRTQGKGRGYVERKELTGPDNGPIQTETTHRIDLSNLSLEEVEALEIILAKNTVNQRQSGGCEGGTGETSEAE